MTDGFTHIVLTRFNTAVDYAPSAMRLDSHWLASRLELFERYCAPSIAAQHDAKFSWIVFCDHESPTWFRDKMESYKPLLSPIYVEGPLLDQVIARKLSETGLVRSPYLITTRLDSDDAIAKGHLASVQKQFSSQVREFIEFPKGLQLFRGHLYNVNWMSNPFLSLIERLSEEDRFTTVFCVPHDRVRSAGLVNSIDSPPQWLQVIHSWNNESCLRGWPRLQSSTHQDFAVSWPSDPLPDNLAARIKLTLAAYRQRITRKLARSLRSIGARGRAPA